MVKLGDETMDNLVEKFNIKAGKIDKCPTCKNTKPMKEVFYQEIGTCYIRILWCSECGTLVTHGDDREVYVPTRKN